MRIPVARIQALGLDWPADRIDDEGMVDLDATAREVDRALGPAENAYFAALGTPDKDRMSDRYYALRALGEHTAAVRRLVETIGEPSLGVGPIPRATIQTLGLPCSPRLEKAFVLAGDELDLVQTMLRLVRDNLYYRREYDGLNDQRRRWGASKDDVSDRWDELAEGMRTTDQAIRELSAILAAVCQ